MTELDDAMREHMAYIVHREDRPFSYKDFHYFEVNGKHYRMAYGTFRNKILELRHNNKVEVNTRSNPFFYTLKGFRFDNGKPMTGNLTEANNISTQRLIRHPLYQILKGNKFGERAIHNLHFNFKAQGVFNILVNNLELRKSIDKDNKGIHFSYFDINKFSIMISVYPNDTCKVVIGCSENPIPLDFEGINRLSMALCRIEERLSNLCIATTNRSKSIPDYKYWIITLWHIGKDSISEYSREMFHCEWSLAEQMILRIYSKTIGGKNNNRVRIEIQQNPAIDIEQLVKKLSIEKILE
jgi:hypothetical protein